MSTRHDRAAADFWVGPPHAPDTYRLVSLIGGGGEGEVWQAVLPLSTEGRSRVAVKIMPAPLSVDPGDDDGWERIGHLLKSLSHPGIVRVLDVFTGPGKHRAGAAAPDRPSRYVVMDHEDGPTLREWCDERPDATASQRIRMLRTVAAALDEMHAGTSTGVPVAHGDVKPANIVVTGEGATVLVDLGLVQLTDAAGPVGHSAPYAAPELRRSGARPSPEADRHAFAVTTAQVLLGQPPAVDPAGWLDLARLEQQLVTHPLSARRPAMVKRLLEALHSPPEARPRRLGPWLDSLSETLSQVTTGGTPVAATYVPPAGETATVRTAAYAAPGPPARRRRRWPWIAAAVLLVAGLGGGAALAAISAGGDRATDAPVAAGPTPAGPPPAGSPTSSPTSGPTSTPPTTRATPTAPVGPPGSRLDPGETAYLSQLDAVDNNSSEAFYGDDSSGTFASGGQQYGRSVQLYAGCGNRDGGEWWVEYDISRDFARLTTTVGLDDSSPADSAVSYTITGDQRVLASGELSLGQTDPLDVPVDGVLRLRLLMRNSAAIQDGCRGAADTRVVFGDAALIP